MVTRFKRIDFGKKVIVLLCICLMASSLLAGCMSKSTNQSETKTETVKNEERFEPKNVMVKGEDQFGDVLIDLQEIDLEYGDSIDLHFSGGYFIESIPYYPEFYGNKGNTILTDYFDDLAVAGIGCSFNETAKIQEGETLTITLDEREKYKKEFEAYNLDPNLLKWEGQSDEAYRNAREITAGNIAKGILYRGSSPFDEEFCRIELMDSFLRENDIQCILNLSDSEETLTQLEVLPEYTAEMLASGKVIPCSLGIVYSDPESMKKIANGLTAMTEKEGPYLIHCSLGRDRTGVISALLEALCGANYDEIVADYMESYHNLHDINMDSSSLQYKLFKQRLEERLEETMLINRDKLPESDLQSAAEEYFIRCGMTVDRINQLREILTTPIQD